MEKTDLYFLYIYMWWHSLRQAKQVFFFPNGWLHFLSATSEETARNVPFRLSPLLGHFLNCLHYSVSTAHTVSYTLWAFPKSCQFPLAAAQWSPGACRAWLSCKCTFKGTLAWEFLVWIGFCQTNPSGPLITFKIILNFGFKFTECVIRMFSDSFYINSQYTNRFIRPILSIL